MAVTAVVKEHRTLEVGDDDGHGEGLGAARFADDEDGEAVEDGHDHDVEVLHEGRVHGHPGLQREAAREGPHRVAHDLGTRGVGVQYSIIDVALFRYKRAQGWGEDSACSKRPFSRTAAKSWSSLAW